MTTWTLPIRRARLDAGRMTGVFANRRVGLLVAVAAVLGVHALLAFELVAGDGGFWIADWDEARHIVNAMEMLRSGNWVVNTYLGATDYFNLKPPASMWAIMLSVHAFGATPFSVRLPSVLSTLLTSGLCSVFAWRWKGPLAALITALAFASSLNLVDLHSGRTADPDALFVLCTTASVLAATAAVRRPWLLTVAVTAFSFAFLTKSYHAALLLVLIVVVQVAFRRTSAVRRRHLAIGMLGLLPLASWAALRFSYDGTTFFAAMVHRDVLDRSRSTIEGHVGGPDYYLTGLQSTFGPWVLVLLVAGFVVLHVRSVATLRVDVGSDTGRTLVTLAAWVVLVFVAFSVVSSKFAWYTVPAFPALCLMIGALVPMAARSSSRLAASALVVLVVAATWSGQAAIQSTRATEVDQPAQVVLTKLAGLHLRPGSHLYIDPAVPGGWPQSLAAAAELSAEPAFQWSGTADFLADRSLQATMLVEQGSSASQQVTTSGTRVVASVQGWSLVQKVPGR